MLDLVYSVLSMVDCSQNSLFLQVMESLHEVGVVRFQQPQRPLLQRDLDRDV